MRPTLAYLAAATFAAATATASAAPMRVTFTDCGAFADCSGASSVMARFDTPGTIVAPAAPPAGSTSANAAVAVDQMLAGSFAGLYIRSFNFSGLIGSEFIFDDATGANGFDYPALTLVSPFRSSDIRLQWGIGESLVLGRFTCINTACSAQTVLQSYIRLDIAAAPAVTVPEPTSASLVALALGAGWFARRRSAG